MVFSIELGLIILFAILGGVMAVRLKQPSVLGLLIVGAIVGPYSLGIIKDTSLINTAIEIGAILLLFTIGIEFSLEHLFNYGLRAIIIAGIKLGTVFLLGYMASILLGFDVITSLYIGVILSITSTVIVIKILEQKGMSKRGELTLLITILILEDIFGVFALMFFSSLNAKAELVPLNLLTELLISLSIIAIFYMILKRLLRPLINWLVKYSTEDTIIFTSIGLCVGMSYLAYLINLSPSVGAFLAGNIVASLPSSKLFEKAIHPFILTFTALFFFSMGTVVNFSVVLNSIYVIAALFFVNIIMKFLSIGFGSYLFSNFKGQQAVFSGIAMLSVGEFSLLIAKEAEATGLGIEFVDITAALIIFSTIAMTALINYTDKIYYLTSRFMPSRMLENIGFAREYLNSLSWTISKDRLGIKRFTIEWQSLRNNIIGLFFTFVLAYFGWYYFKPVFLAFFKSKLIAYFVVALIVMAVLFPAFNIIKRTLSLLRILLEFFVKLYPKEIANEKKIFRNFAIVILIFVLLILLPSITSFLRLKPVFYVIIIALLMGMLFYSIRISQLIHTFVKKHHSNLARLSEKYKAMLKKKAKKREAYAAKHSLEQTRTDEIQYRLSKILYVAFLIVILFFGGTIFYYYAEKLSFVDAMYLTASTLTRVGYGDVVPKTDIGKVFTIFYIFSAIGIVIYGLSVIAKFLFDKKTNKSKFFHSTKNFSQTKTK